ncbi:Ribosome-releasing factor 2 [Fusarium oxysporum f. sp. albedinis]|nr:Ribosome-releasing factor 2 [Fusarium oxysporum f. sp. albedinis]
MTQFATFIAPFCISLAETDDALHSLILGLNPQTFALLLMCQSRRPHKNLLKPRQSMISESLSQTHFQLR